MPSNLLNTAVGNDAFRAALQDLIRRRMSRFFKTHFVKVFDDWVDAGKPVGFDFTTIDDATALGNLNFEHDEEILNLYELLKIVDLTYGFDANIYVDTVNGSDVTGDGSIDSPLRTMNFALRLVPPVLQGTFNIFVSAPTGHPVTYLPDLNIKFGPGGQLSIQGIDDPEVQDGPFTSTGWTDIGTGSTMGHVITVAGAGWVANAYRGYFVHVLSGTWAGCYYAIRSNSADMIVIPHTIRPMTAGDDFEIVAPGTQIFLGFQQWRGTFDGPQNDTSARFLMTNVNFWNIVPEFCGNNSCDMWFGLVKFINASLVGNSVNVNRYEPYEPTQIQDADLQVTGQPFTYCENAETYIQHGSWYYTAHELIFNLVGFCEFANCAFDNYTSENAAAGSMVDCLCGNNGSDVIYLTDNETLTIDGLFINEAATAIIVVNGKVHAKNLEGTTANITGYTISLGVTSTVSFDGTPVSGTTGDIAWGVAGGGVAFPGVAGTGVTDAIGSWCIKVS
jgi:hypothetical protein